MTRKISIHEVVKRSKFTRNVQLIDVPVAGKAITLLRVKEMPELAFVMWVKKDSSTLAQMQIWIDKNHPSKTYPVVCACCPSETEGLKCPVKGEAKYKKWERKMAEKFKKAIVKTCRANSINIIFMRKAEEWNIHYGNVLGLSVVEAQGYHDAYYEFYGRKVVSKSLGFIANV